ncbi:MAG: HAD-IB family phosphatase [Sphingopyxis sp.]|nr:HAD-IB family phosphatase [Sphingopyxis sp.]
MTGQRIAIYDLDETLTRHATYTPFLIRSARALHPWRLALLPIWIALMLGHVCGLYGRAWLKQAGFRLLVGRADDPRLSDIIADFADHIVATMRPGARAAWDRDAAEGATRVIATAALALYAKAIADRLGADVLIATQISDDGRIDGSNCYGPEKFRRVMAWFDSLPHGRSAYVVTMWSDSTADAPLLDWADHAMFVTHSATGSARALACGWRPISFR